MDAAILPTAAALFGSMIGGTATFAASWLTQQRQLRIQTLAERALKLEAVYSDFIVEASKRITESWSQHAERPEVVANLYSALERMRLISSDGVVRAAESTILSVIDAYAAPDRTFDDLRQSLQGEERFRDPLRGFIDACLAELAELRGTAEQRCGAGKRRRLVPEPKSLATSYDKAESR